MNKNGIASSKDMGFPPSIDLDVWHFTAAEEFAQYSLVRDELLQMQVGKSHLFRKPDKKGISKEAISMSLKILNSPTESGEYFRNDARIGERRKRIQQVIGNVSEGGAALVSHFENRLNSIMRRYNYESEKVLTFPVSDELIAASFVTAGPARTMAVFGKFLTWKISGSCWLHVEPNDNSKAGYVGSEWDELGEVRENFPLPVPEFTGASSYFPRGMFDALIPKSALILNEEECGILIDFIFQRIEDSIDKGVREIFPRIIESGRYQNWKRNSAELEKMNQFARKRRYSIKLAVSENKRWETPLEFHTTLGLILRKYPSLVRKLEGRGWKSEPDFDGNSIRGSWTISKPCMTQ